MIEKAFNAKVKVGSVRVSLSLDAYVLIDGFCEVESITLLLLQ